MSIVLPSQDNLPQGPFYLDTESCQCALQTPNQTDVDRVSVKAWRCTGYIKDNAYIGENGKWLLPINEDDGSAMDTSTGEPDYRGGIPPNLQETYIIHNVTHELQTLDDTVRSQLSIIDNACSGKNDTLQSQKYYEAVEQFKVGIAPEARDRCAARTEPVELQNGMCSWISACPLSYSYSSSKTCLESLLLLKHVIKLTTYPSEMLIPQYNSNFIR